MKGRHLLFVLLILLFGTPAFADWQKGADAYDREDFASALKEWKPLAQQGDAYAQFRVALLYQLGKGVPQDYKAALKWYKLAAEQGKSVPS